MQDTRLGCVKSIHFWAIYREFNESQVTRILSVDAAVTPSLEFDS
jgi:hypothetical protein